MQLTLNSGSHVPLDNGDTGTSVPTTPNGAGNGSSRRGSDASEDDSSLPNGNPGGRIIAALPGNSGTRRPANNTPDSADASDNDHSTDSHASTPRRSGRRRDDSEHESTAPLPTRIPEPTLTPKPTPTPVSKPVEVRERPEAKVPDVFRPARIRSQAQPEYPSSARAAHEEGDTTLRLSINADGDVTDADVVGSSGSAALDQAAARGARRWRYEPARQGDTAVASTKRAVVHWHLRD